MIEKPDWNTTGFWTKTEKAVDQLIDAVNEQDKRLAKLERYRDRMLTNAAKDYNTELHDNSDDVSVHGDELKPCPFCGDIPEIYHQKDGLYWYVECGNDEDPEYGCGSMSRQYDTELEVIAAWNRRAEPHPPEQIDDIEDMRWCADCRRFMAGEPKERECYDWHKTHWIPAEAIRELPIVKWLQSEIVHLAAERDKLKERIDMGITWAHNRLNDTARDKLVAALSPREREE